MTVRQGDPCINFTIKMPKNWHGALVTDARDRGISLQAALIDSRWHGYLPSMKRDGASDAWRGRAVPLAAPLAALARANAGLAAILAFNSDIEGLRADLGRLRLDLMGLPRRFMSALSQKGEPVDTARRLSATLTTVEAVVSRCERLIDVALVPMPAQAIKAAQTAQAEVGTALSLLAPRLSTRVDAGKDSTKGPAP